MRRRKLPASWLFVLCLQFGLAISQEVYPGSPAYSNFVDEYNRTGSEVPLDCTECDPIKTVCDDDWMILTPRNLEDSRTVEWYAQWTRNELPALLKKGPLKEEMKILGRELLGENDLFCSADRKACIPIPKCHEIAKHMKIKTKVPSSEEERKELQDNLVELRRRYFLGQRLDAGMQYFGLMRTAIKDAKEKLRASTDEISLDFATRADSEAMDDCQRQKAIITSALSALASVIAFAINELGPIAIPHVAVWLGVTKQTMLKSTLHTMKDGVPKEVFLRVGTAETIQSAFSNGQFAANSFYTQWAMYEGALPPEHWAHDVALHTNLDLSRCSNAMGQFGDQHEQVQDDLGNSVEVVFDEIIEVLDEWVQLAYFSNTFLKDGRSALSSALNSSDWAFGAVRENDIKVGHLIKESIVDQTTESLIAQTLTARQCFIKCVQLDPKDPLHDLKGMQINDTDLESDLGLSTFYPEREILLLGNNTNHTDIKPSLQCQFACLKQNDEAVPYFPTDTLAALNKIRWTHPHRTPRQWFSQAVLNDLGQFRNASLLEGHQFTIPTCVSPHILLDDANINNNQNHNRTWFDAKGWWHWANTTRSFFPFHCGDWKASDTANFLNRTPLPYHRKEQEDFWTHSLRFSLKLLEDKPITHFFTLCKAGMHIQHKSWFGGKRWYADGSEDICDQIEKEVEGMDELEATLWFCFGPTTETLLFNKEKRGTVRFTNHKELCDLLHTRESAIGLVPEEYQKIISRRYKAKLEQWKLGGVAGSVYRFEEDHSHLQYTNSSKPPEYPPQLPSPPESAESELQKLASQNMRGSAESELQKLASQNMRGLESDVAEEHVEAKPVESKPATSRKKGGSEGMPTGIGNPQPLTGHA